MFSKSRGLPAAIRLPPGRRETPHASPHCPIVKVSSKNLSPDVSGSEESGLSYPSSPPSSLGPGHVPGSQVTHQPREKEGPVQGPLRADAKAEAAARQKCPDCQALAAWGQGLVHVWSHSEHSAPDVIMLRCWWAHGLKTFGLGPLQPDVLEHVTWGAFFFWGVGRASCPWT